MCFRTPGFRGLPRRVASGAAIATVLVGWAAPLSAQIGPPRDALVRVHAERTWVARYVGLAGDSLVLALDGGHEVRVAADDVRRFQRARSPGAARAALIGGVIGALGLGLFADESTTDLTERFMAVGLTVGAGTGYMLGRGPSWGDEPTPRRLDLDRFVRERRPVRVAAWAHPDYEGTVVGFDGNTVVLETARGEWRVVQTRAIRSIAERARGSHASSGALLGAGAGLAAAIMANERDMKGAAIHPHVVVGAATGALVGRLLGRALPAYGWQRIPFTHPLPAGR